MGIVLRKSVLVLKSLLSQQKASPFNVPLKLQQLAIGEGKIVRDGCQVPVNSSRNFNYKLNLTAVKRNAI